MDLNYTAEEEGFRAEVREFLRKELPQAVADKLRLGRRLTKDDMVDWQKTLYRRGWGAGMWPKRFGGGGWSVVQQHIFDEECAAAGAPAQLRASNSAAVRQFMTGSADGPVPFHYPAPDYATQLFAADEV